MAKANPLNGDCELSLLTGLIDVAGVLAFTVFCSTGILLVQMNRCAG